MVMDTCVDDGEDERAHMQAEKDQLAAEEMPDTRHRSVLVTADARQKHLTRHFTTQRLRLMVAIDAMSSHVYHPARTSIATQSSPDDD